MKRVILSACIALLPSLARADDARPVVHVDGPSTVLLERVEVNGDRTPVCHAPCDRPLDARSSYLVTGDGLRTSNRFELPARASALDVAVKPAASGSFTTGVVLTSLGGVFLGGAIAFLASSVALNAAFGSLWLGAAAIGCGAASLATGIPGIVLLANNLQSRATVMWGDERAAARVAPAIQAPVFPVSGSF